MRIILLEQVFRAFKIARGEPYHRRLYKAPKGATLKKWFETLEGEHSELALLGKGQQTILPPSIHPNGGMYKWIKGKSHLDIPSAEVPQWMLDLMAGKKPLASAEQGPGENQAQRTLRLFFCVCLNATGGLPLP